MSRLRRFFGKLSNLFHPARAERELAREIISHAALLEEEFQRSGMTPEQARLAARRRLSGIEQAKELHRAERSFLWLEEARRDVHYALRGLGRTPGFTAVAILTLALGIGANTAIFSVINGVFLKPLPFDDSDRVVTLVANEPAAESDRGAPSRDSGSITVAELTELRSRATTLSHVAFSGMPTLMTMSGRGETKHLEGMDVSPGIFAVLGVPAMLGRTFGADEEALGQDRVILLSYAAWQRDFGADPDVLGESVVLSSSVFGRTSETYAIIGVMPDGFEFDNGQKQFWTPTTWEPDSGGVMVARLADGVSLQAASAEINAMLRAIRKDRQATTYELVRWQDEIAEPVKPALLVLTLAVGCVLLIACANVANLLLARSATRQREIAIRIALGAGRARMVRQLLTESVVLALLGGAGGAAFAYGGIRLLRSLATTLGRMDLGFYLPFPRLDAIGLDVSVLAFTAAASLVAGLLIGLAPAARYARPDQAEVLREGTAAAAWGFGLAGRGGVRGLLVVAQIAMALTLLAAGALLVRSFVALSRVDAGYDPTNVLTFQVALPHERYPNARLEAFAEDLVGRLRLLPAVERAGYARQLPMVVLRDTMTFERRPIGAVPSPHSRDDTDRPSADLRLVSRDYLEAMGMRVIAGRAFTEADRAGRPRVVVINRALARRYFPRENPLGTTIGTSFGSFEIIGIVDDVRQFGLDAAPTPQYFVDYRQWPDEADAPPVFPLGPYYTVRPAASPASFTAAVRRIARELDHEAGLYNVATMEQIVSNSTYRPRLYATLLGIFAGVGVCVAAIGLYGVMAYAVSQRTHEIGIRMALGARRADVMGLVLRQSALLTMVGIALGLSAAAAVTRYLEGMLFGLTPLDAPTFVAVSVMFALIAMLAAYVPARRATRVDPTVALRYE